MIVLNTNNNQITNETGLNLFSRLLINAMLGLILAVTVGAPASVGAATVVGVSVLSGEFYAGRFCLCRCIYRDLDGRTGKKLRAGITATWLDGIPDYSDKAENDIIHLIDVGGDPDVLINNTSLSYSYSGFR